MKGLSKVFSILALVFLMLFLFGCSSFVTFNDRAMSIDDVINISKTKVDAEVLISQIDATYSKFQLTPEDIVRLKNEGVDDEVIKYMVESDITPDRFSWEYGYSQYDYWFNYYNAYYYPIYDYYYSPMFHYRYGRMPYNSPSSYYDYPTPYVSRRQPGMVGKYYRYYPLFPPDGRDNLRRDRMYRDEEKSERRRTVDPNN